MSHFSVLCVGDVDFNMAPFHEFEVDGRDDEFIKTIDSTEEYRQSYLTDKEYYQEKLEEYNKEINGASEELKKVLDKKFEDNTKYSFKGSTFKEYLDDFRGIHIFGKDEEIILDAYTKFEYAVATDKPDVFNVFIRTNPDYFYDY